MKGLDYLELVFGVVLIISFCYITCTTFVRTAIRELPSLTRILCRSYY